MGVPRRSSRWRSLGRSRGSFGKPQCLQLCTAGSLGRIQCRFSLCLTHVFNAPDSLVLQSFDFLSQSLVFLGWTSDTERACWLHWEIHSTWVLERGERAASTSTFHSVLFHPENKRFWYNTEHNRPTGKHGSLRKVKTNPADTRKKTLKRESSPLHVQPCCCVPQRRERAFFRGSPFVFPRVRQFSRHLHQFRWSISVFEATLSICTTCRDVPPSFDASALILEQHLPAFDTHTKVAESSSTSTEGASHSAGLDPIVPAGPWWQHHHRSPVLLHRFRKAQDHEEAGLTSRLFFRAATKDCAARSLSEASSCKCSPTSFHRTAMGEHVKTRNWSMLVYESVEVNESCDNKHAVARRCKLYKWMNTVSDVVGSVVVCSSHVVCRRSSSTVHSDTASSLAQVRCAASSYHFCEQNTLIRHIFSHLHALIWNVARDIGSRCLAHVTHVSSACCCCLDTILDTIRLSTLCSPPSLSSSFSFSCSSSSMWVRSMRSPHSQLMSPTSSTTTTSQRPLTYSSRSPPATADPQICMTWSSMTNTIGRALSSPLFQEREDPASRRQVYHSPYESLLSSQSSSVGHVRTGSPVFDVFGSLISNVKENPRPTQKVSKSGFFWNDRKSKISLIIEQRLKDTSSRPINDRRSIQKLKTNNIDEINNFFMNIYWNKIENFVKLMRKVSMRWKNWSDFKDLRSIQFQGEDWSKIETLSLNSQKKSGITERNQLHEWFEIFSRCWISTQWTFPRCQSTCVFPTSSNSWRNAPFFWSAGAATMGHQVFGTRMVYGETFLQIQMRLLQHLIRRNWLHGVLIYRNQFTHHWRWRMRIKHQFRIRGASPDRQPKIQSSPVSEILQRIVGTDQQRLQISDLHFDKFLNPTTFACSKIRFKTEVCTCSQFPTEAVLWIKEVELVDSVDDLKSSCSVRGSQMPNFEVFDAKIASALNRIIHDTPFKRRVSLEEQKAPKEDRFLRGRQIAYLIYEYFRVTGSQWFRRELCRPIHYCSSKWWRSGIRFKVGRNSYYQWRKPHLMTSGKDCTNWEYESLRNSRPYWNCMTWRFIRRS